MNLTRLTAGASAAALCLLLANFTGGPAGTGPGPVAPPVPTPGVLAIRDVRLFDGIRTWPRATVVIRDGRIASVAVDAAVPAGAAVVEGQGRTLLPGLIDSHVHAWGDARRDALRFGVTTQVDMFGDPARLRTIRQERESRAPTDQADLWSAGMLATAEGGHGTQFGLAVDPIAGSAEAGEWVAARQREGSDFIKVVREDLHVYTGARQLPTLDAATAAAVIGAAQARGLRAVVHASAQQAARESLLAGADGLVHVFQDAVADPGFVSLARDTGAFVVPTLTVVAGMAGERSNLAGDPRIAPHLAPAQRQSLQARLHGGPPHPELIANARRSVRALHAAGVPILAGTDAPNPNTAHGASLHEELAQLVRAGLSAEQALAAATSAPAAAFGLADRGRVAPGLRADLVLVDGDPTGDIAATRSIVAVWKNGHRIDRDLARPAPGIAAPRLAPGRISRFDEDRVAASLAGWAVTSDRMLGGHSDARIERVRDGANGSPGALRVSGRVVAGASFPWAGAMFSPGGGPMQPVDAGHARELVFRVRGDGRSYAALVFSGAPVAPMPAVQAFTATPEWTRVRLPLAGFAGADAAALAGIGFTAGKPPGNFWFELDDVEIR